MPQQQGEEAQTGWKPTVKVTTVLPLYLFTMPWARCFPITLACACHNDGGTRVVGGQSLPPNFG